MRGRPSTDRVWLRGGGPKDGQTVSVPSGWRAYRPAGAAGVYVRTESGEWRWKAGS
jgi:hypothetical protein